MSQNNNNNNLAFQIFSEFLSNQTEKGKKNKKIKNKEK